MVSFTEPVPCRPAHVMSTLRRETVLAVVGLCCLVLSALPLAGAVADDEATRQLLAAGDKALGSGRSHYPDALSKYTEALVRNPHSERGLYSRAELLASLNDRESAIADLDTLLSVSPGHPQALALRMTLSAREGRLQDAVGVGHRLAAVHTAAGRKAKAAEVKAQVAQLERHWAAWRRLSYVLDAPLSKHRPAGTDAALKRQYEECVDLLHLLIRDFAPDSVDLRLRRASCALAADNNQVATQEVKYVLTQNPQDLAATALNARALRGLGALEQARSEARRCLSVDPEYAPCAQVTKRIRAQQKHTKAVQEALDRKKYEVALNHIAAAFADEGGSPPYAESLVQWRCQAYEGLRDADKGVPACEEGIRVVGASSPAAAKMYLRIAELHIVNDDLDEAERAAKKAGDLQMGQGATEEVLRKIQNLRKAGARKDYYKILGVKKSASTQEIRRAYRKLAKQFHPDQLRSKDMSAAEREKSDTRFRNINEAKEVLLDEDMRARYDNGEDVMNPQAQQAQQGEPFFGHPFFFQGGGPPPNFFGGGGGGPPPNFFFHQFRHG